MNDILFASILIGAIGLIAGIILAISSIVMSVKSNEKQEMIRSMLPGANCGACGYTGCDGYAGALAFGNEKNAALCKPGGQSTTNQISAYLGLEAIQLKKTTAMVLCQGNCHNTVKKADYQGIKSCHMAKQVANGDSKCGYGCLGYGDCVAVCEYDAIHLIDDVAFVDASKCTSCMQCIQNCPQKIIQLIPYEKATSIVFCHNEDRAPIANKVCKTSCISCGLCVKNCPEHCIAIENNHAVINYQQCTNCGACQKVCPHHCILSLYPLKEYVSRNTH